MRPWLLAPLLLLTGCGPVVIPLFGDFEVPLGVPEGLGYELEEGGMAFELSTGAQDVGDYRAELPPVFQERARLELARVTLDAPPEGHLSRWVDSLALYLSDDDVLSDDDILLAEFDQEALDAPHLIVDIDRELRGTIGILMVGNLYDLPEALLAVPVTLEVNAILKI